MEQFQSALNFILYLHQRQATGLYKEYRRLRKQLTCYQYNTEPPPQIHSWGFDFYLDTVVKQSEVEHILLSSQQQAYEMKQEFMSQEKEQIQAELRQVQQLFKESHQLIKTVRKLRAHQYEEYLSGLIRPGRISRWAVI